MSDTPETDLWLKQQIVCNYEHEMVSAGFARTLERERNEARLQVKLLRVENNHNWQANDLAEQAFRERDHAQALVAEMKQAIVWAKAEAKERLHRLDQAACERRTWLEAHEKMKRERDEANAQMCQAIGHLSDIAQTCQDWLDSIIQQPAVDFIKAIRDWAKRKVEGK